MNPVNHKVIVVLITICAQICHNYVTFCVSNDGSNNTIDHLSAILTECANETEVSVHLTGGVHYLHENLDFSSEVKKTQIIGDKPSTIMCINASGIRFSEKQVILKISNITFKNCSRYQIAAENVSLPIAIYLNSIDKCILENVTVSGTEGYGYYAYNCKHQSIKSCKFLDNNYGHAKMTFNTITNVSIVVANTLFENGYSKNSSGGLEVYIPKNIQCKLDIINCNFTANEGGKGSHMLITIENNKRNETKVENASQINVAYCIFEKAKGSITGYAAVITTTTYFKNEVAVIIRNSTFINNNINALQIIQVYYVHIDYCTASNNTGTAISIHKHPKTKDITIISNSKFNKNSRGLLLIFRFNTGSGQSSLTQVCSCGFVDHHIDTSSKAVIQIESEPYYDSWRKRATNNNSNTVIIESTHFEGNHAKDASCSVLHIHAIKTIILNSLTFNNNSITGINSIASYIMIKNYLNMTDNSGVNGGAIELRSRIVPSIPLSELIEFSKIALEPHSRIKLVQITMPPHVWGCHIHR